MQELEERCLIFAKGIRDFCRSIRSDTINLVYIRQVVRSSSSIGANYIEANEKLGPNDLKMHLKIARKEAKETRFWLRLLEAENPSVAPLLLQESEELRRIFSAIINKITS